MKPDLHPVQRATIRILNHVDRHRGKYSALAVASVASVIFGYTRFEIRQLERVIDALGGNEPAGYFVDIPLEK